MIKVRPQWWLEFSGLLPPSQAGFRAGRSCSDNLAALALMIEEAFCENVDVLSCFLDVQGAFDNVNSDILLDKLYEIGCPNSIANFVSFLTHERDVTFATGPSSTIQRKVFKGLPQGGVLSPLLYLIYVKNIAEDLDSKIYISQFADDIAISCRVSSPSDGKRAIEGAVASVSKKLDLLGLSLVPRKTVLIHFNNKGIPPGSCAIKVNNCLIKSSKRVNFLGILFDYQFKFKEHIQNIRHKCFKRLKILKFICGIRWGAEPVTLLILYKSLIRSVIEYNSFIYFPKSVSQLLPIERIQYAALRTALGYRNSTPNNVLLGKSKCWLLQYRAKFLCNKFLIKSLSNRGSILYFTIDKLTVSPLWIKLLNKSRTILPGQIDSLKHIKEDLKTENNYAPYLYSFATLLSVIEVNTELGLLLKKSTEPNSLFLEHFHNRPPNSISFFTDGSKNETGNVGAALFSPELNRTMLLGLNKHISSFSAECVAIKNALDIATEFTHENVFIYSDSLSAILSLATCSVNAKVNSIIYDIRNTVKNHFHGKRKLMLYWIPAHVGISLNEKADTLAKEATNLEISSDIRVVYSDYTHSFYKQFKAETEKQLLEDAKFKGTKFFAQFYSSRSKPWFAQGNTNITRDFITWTCRLRANHYQLATSLFRINLAVSPECQCGSAEQDMNHVMWQCPLYEDGRGNMIDKLCKKGFYPPHTMDAFLFKPEIQPLLTIQKFLKKHCLYL